jgi:hypothetical protein
VVHKDLEILDIINGYTVYSIGYFEDKVPTSSTKLKPEFFQKIQKYCYDFNHAAEALPSRSFDCPFCGIEIKDSELEVPRYSSNRYWLEFNMSIFSFPGILYHLIIVHKYVPPDEFIDAVMNPLSKTVLLFDNDERITRCNKETMEMLLARHNSSKENDESREVITGDGKHILVWKRAPTFIEKIKRFFKKK